MLTEWLHINEYGSEENYFRVSCVEADGNKWVSSYKKSSDAFYHAMEAISNLHADYAKVLGCINGNECFLKCTENDEWEYIECPFTHSFPVVITVRVGCYDMVWTVEE